MERPIWFLDVDGVLNANNPKWSEAPKTWAVFSRVTGKFYKMRYSLTLLRNIFEISKVCDIVWSSTWSDEPETLNETFGFSFASAFNYEEERKVSPNILVCDLKRQVAYDAVSSGRRVIWTDDEIIEDKDLEFAGQTPNALFIKPKSRTGLTKEDIIQIKSFVGL